MKKFLFLCTFLSVFIASAQSEDLTKPYTFTEVVIVDSTLTAKNLYANAKIWFTNTFKDAREVILLDDSENNILFGRGMMYFNSKIFVGGGAMSGGIEYEIKIMCKDGRYKYIITNFNHEKLGILTNERYFKKVPAGSEKYKIKMTTELRAYVYLRTTALINNLKVAMDKPLPTNEDW